MNEHKLQEYIQYFKGKDNVFICFKTKIEDKEVVDDRFFVYAHGGVLCKLPIINSKQSNFVMFDKEYIKHLDKDDDKEKFEIEYNKAVKGREEIRFEFYNKNWETIMTIMKNRAEGIKYNGEKTHTHKERQRGTIIAKNNCDVITSDFNICDMEFCVSFGDRKAKPDLVAVNVNSANDKDEVTIAYIEYKCTRAGVAGKNNSLKKHYDDMRKFSSSNSLFNKLVIDSVINRYNKMVEYGLINAKSLKDIELNYSEIKSRIIFLITHKDEIGQKSIENQCRELLYNNKDFVNGNLSFQYGKDENEVYLLEDNFKSELKNNRLY